MVNESLRIGIDNDASSLRKLSLLSYDQLAEYDSPSYHKLCAISRATGILAARKKSIRRGFPTRTPYAAKPQLVSCYGFKIRNEGLEIPVSRGKISQPTTDQASSPGHLSTKAQGSLFHAHPDKALFLHRMRPI
jgi:hypothetical protein